MNAGLQNPLIVAVDTSDVNQAQKLVDELYFHVGAFKFGLEAMMAHFGVIGNPRTRMSVEAARFVELAQLLKQLEGHIMWDVKLNDIPNTMGHAVKALQGMNPWGITVHASSGRAGMRAAVQNRGESNILAVTVLTSFDTDACVEVYYDDTTSVFENLATLAGEEGVQGIVCSPEELEAFDMLPDFDLIKVVPGIRPYWTPPGDQKRVMTPREAMERGADYLVIGRPITSPIEEIGSPSVAAQRILEQISAFV